MNMFSLRTIIDDIMLIVRNNNISESEDLSRAQIAAWVMHYRAHLIKLKQDENGGNDGDWFDDSFVKEIGPLKLEKVPAADGSAQYVKETTEPIDDIFSNDEHNIISVTDESGCPIQYMNKSRRHFHFFRKYTFGELTWNFNDSKIRITGIDGYCKFKYIYVKYVSTGENEDEDEMTIPGWMVPPIKDMIFKNELAFMVRMPSDDENNSTLDGIKPGSPQQTSRMNNEK